MFACYEDKDGHLPAHMAKPAIFQYVKTLELILPTFFKEGREKI